MTSVKTTLIQDIIISHLDYYNNFLTGLFASILGPSESIFNAVARIIII